MSTRRPRLFLPLALASVLMTPALLTPLARPAAAQTTPELERTFMRVTAPTLDVKSGPQDYYYGFFKLAEGDIVEVVDERANGFTAILTKGPRFVAGYALLRVRDDESFTISGTEQATVGGRAARVGTSRQRLQMLYPNIDEADLLKRSWRMIRRIDPGTEVQVMGSPITDEGVSLYRIPLPTDALGFVPTAELAPATEAQIGDFLSWERDPAAWLARRRAEAEERRLAAEAAQRAEAERLAAAAEAEAEARRLAAAERAETAPPVATPERAVPATTDPEVESEETPATETPATETADETPESNDDGGTGTGTDADAGSANEGDVTATDPESADGASESADGASETDDAAADAGTEATEGEAEADPEAETDEPAGSDAVSNLPPAERFAALEQAFDLLRNEDVRRVEVTPLAGLYRAFAADMTGEDPEKATYATTRARQLELWARLQAQRDRIEALRADVDQTDVALAEAARTIQSQLGFSAVGRLASSRIFDGNRLPRLLRLEALDSGRTIAYVRDVGTLELDSRVGEIVGLFGERTYDPGLQLDILDAERVRSVRLDVEEGGDPAGD